MPKIGKLSIISKEPHLEIKWEIKNFFSLPKLLFFSPSFSYDDETWYCRMDPSGDIWDHRSGWIYLALVRKSIGPPIRVKFTIALKTVNGEKVLESHYTEWFKKAGFGHPYLTFTSRSKLLERVSELLPSGILTVVYTLKILERSEDTNGVKEIQTAEVNKGDQSKITESEVTQASASKQTGAAEFKESGDVKEILTAEVNKGGQSKVADSDESDEASVCKQTGADKIKESVSFINVPEYYGIVTDVNHLLKERRGVDVTFVLETPNGETEIFAHQLILAVMSTYFADKFYDGQRNKGHQIIPLKGINPKAFEEMIRYCYGYQPSLKTTEEVYALFKVASMFKVINLLNSCCIFFRSTKIESGNVFSVLEISEEMEDKSLKDKCCKFLEGKTREVLASYELRDVWPSMVRIIIDLSKLSLHSEYELIKWMFDWSKVKYEENGSIYKSTRDYLDHFLQDLDFMSLAGEEFAMLCKDYPDFFSSDEMASISLNIALPGTRKMPEWYGKNLKHRIYTESKE